MLGGDLEDQIDADGHVRCRQDRNPGAGALSAAAKVSGSMPVVPIARPWPSSAQRSITPGVTEAWEKSITTA